MKDIMSYEFQQLPAGPFEIIYADPPWSYGNCQFAGTKVTSSADFHYPTLSVKAMHKLPVSEVAAKDSLLFMWSSSPHLDQAIALAEHWGFAYKTVAFVWDKQKVNPGSYTMSQCELCLVFKRGRIPQPRGARNIRQFLSEPRRTHSQKPDTVRERIHEMFPTQAKIELFARIPTNGWTVWGLESDGQRIIVKKEKLAARNDRAGRQARRRLHYMPANSVS